MAIKNVKLNDKEFELYALIYSKYSKDIDKHHDNRQKQILFRRLRHNSIVGGLTLLTVWHKLLVVISDVDAFVWIMS